MHLLLLSQFKYAMKLGLFAMVLFSHFISNAQPPLEEIRKLYDEALKNSTQAKRMEKQLQDCSVEQGAVIYGYKGMSKMILARDSFNPYHKLSFFNEGKALLEEAIKQLPHNAEIRLLRFSIQTHAPSLLNYNDKTQTDKELLLHYLLQGNNKEDAILFQRIKEILLATDVCTESEKQSIKNLQN